MSKSVYILGLLRSIVKNRAIRRPQLNASGVTHAAIAARLNATPQTISNAMRSLQESGAICFDHHRILIIDEDRLRAIAQL